MPIDYEAVPYKLTYSIVGENAVGKTQLLSDFARDLIDENNHHNFENVPLISSVLVICSSTFDSCVARYSIIAKAHFYLSIILEGVKSAACPIYLS